MKVLITAKDQEESKKEKHNKRPDEFTRRALLNVYPELHVHSLAVKNCG